MHFSTRNALEAPIFNYNIHGRELLVRNCHRDLGLLVTSNLHWNEHYDMLLKKAYKTLGLIRRIFQNTRVVQTKKLLYLTLVRSKLQYCSPIWRPQFINDIKNIENIQRRATKFILNDYSSDYKSRLIKLNLLPLMLQMFISSFSFCRVFRADEYLLKDTPPNCRPESSIAASCI